MMKRFFLFFIAIYLYQIAISQNKDSIVFFNAEWKKDQISKNIQLNRFHFTDSNLFHSKQYISYVIIKKSKKNKAAIAADPQKLITVSDFVKNTDALVAINGNFFDMKNGGAVDYTKVDNKVINENRKTKNGQRDFHQKAGVVIHKNNISIEKWNGKADWETNTLKSKNILLNGPLLIYQNLIEKLDSNAFNNNRHPRTCVGIKKDGSTIILVADGRNTNAYGLTLAELTKMMQWLGCTNAINFDGGGSSTLWIKGLGIVNHPSDNKKWDHEGERKVANAFYIK
ncbi:MAG: phosphodiester glycosidase family protein [Chitinophagaceae bacterium]|nr:MAG: phosphodiester glycosidase family protein [Chitinophagaceae bacterium]